MGEIVGYRNQISPFRYVINSAGRQIGAYAYNMARRYLKRRSQTSRNERSFKRQRRTVRRKTTKRPTSFFNANRVLYRKRKTFRRFKRGGGSGYKNYLRYTIKTLGKQKFQFQNTTEYVIGAGKNQAISRVLGTGYDTHTGGSEGPFYNTSNSDLINCMNLIQGNTTDSAGKMLLSNMRQDITITLVDNTQTDYKVFVDIYKVYAVKDSVMSMEEAYEAGYDWQQKQEPPTGSTLLTATVQKSDWNSSPFLQSKFGRYWKIQSVKRVVLGSLVAQSTSWSQTLNRDRVIARSSMTEGDAALGSERKSGYISLRGITNGYLIILSNPDGGRPQNVNVRWSRVYTCARMEEEYNTLTEVSYPNPPGEKEVSVK